MTEQEKELMEIIDYWVDKTISPNVKSQCIFDSIINRYPQVLAEKVWEDDYFSDSQTDFMLQHKLNKFHGKKIRIFIQEVQS